MRIVSPKHQVRYQRDLPRRLAPPPAALLLLAALIASAAGAQSTVVPSRPAMAHVTGTVYDSVTHEPLGGAIVQLVDAANPDRGYSVRADSAGRFSIDSVRPGQYVAGFFHPSVDVLGIEPPLRLVTINEGRGNFLALVTPDATRIMATVCGTHREPDSTGAMAGVVRDAESGAPIAGANLVVSWLKLIEHDGVLRTQHHQVTAKADADGSYRLCGLPGADTVRATVQAPGKQSGVLWVELPPRSIVRRDFSMGDSVTVTAAVPDSAVSATARRQAVLPRGSATLSGIVRGPEGEPLPGATVVVWGTELDATTDAAGRFAIAGLPAGSYSVVARSVGFAPRLETVNLSARRPATVEMALTERIHQLSRVMIEAKATAKWLDVNGFTNRSHSGMGHYISASDEALKTAYQVSDALRMTPGVQVMARGPFNHIIYLAGGCVPTVFVDRMRMLDGYAIVDELPANQIAGIEVYAGVGEAPPEYSGDGCGAILIWTKR